MEKMFLGFLTFAFMMAFISVEGLWLNRSVIFCENSLIYFSNTVGAACDPGILSCDGDGCYSPFFQCKGFGICKDGSDAAGCPTNPPTNPPMILPTNPPTNAPTDAPTEAPTEAPTDAPTDAPTNLPTEAPTNAPTNAPS